ncbi:MAG: hypothetical protein U5K71_05170 [Gracilimonas sp.]|nr:hypothetical protein [Gracilimonas sp.]
MQGLFGAFESQAQSTIERELKFASLPSDTALHLGDWVVPTSIEITFRNSVLEDSFWVFNEREGELRFIPKEKATYNSVVIKFRVLPYSFPRTYQNLAPRRIDSSLYAEPDSLRKMLSDSDRDPYSSSGLRQSGSLSRGVIVGSNQDFSLESGLNFELSGALTENININASLTDQSIPIQPDGTTQNLREFDKVFIELEAPNSRVAMGDVDLSLDESSFARFNRRLQGATGSLDLKHGEYQAAFSVVRGTYRSMRFSGQDGFQGPYRLTNSNGQEFVTILAGTEQVYINGQRVNRGAENDYIIDYGIGEVTFTNQQLITDETRIVIEYEYLDQNFTNTAIAGETKTTLFSGRLDLGATVIRQADGDELLSQRTLTSSDIDLLQQVGDDLEQAVIDGARIATEDEREQFVLYTKVDTTINGQNLTIYEHRPGAATSIYRVQFTKVSEGEGSYRRATGQTNGFLYEWVGEGDGDYTPFRQLDAPESKQMVALRGGYKVNEFIELTGEFATSDYDANRFSGEDDGNNTDIGYTSGLKINEAETRLGTFSVQFDRRYTGNNFEFFERTRDVEFDRVWNISRGSFGKELTNELEVSLSPAATTIISAGYGTIDLNRFEGERQNSSVSVSLPENLLFYYKQDWIRSEDIQLNEKGNWFRQQGDIAKMVGIGSAQITPYINFEHENRQQRDLITDSLTAVSEKFYDVGPGVNIELKDIDLDVSIAYRNETGVLDNQFQKRAEAIEQRYRLSFDPANHFRTVNEVRIRNKEFTDMFLNSGAVANRRGILVRSVTDYGSDSNLMEGEVFYEANTQRRALLEETYIEVGPEIGQYVWDDINNDGVKQIDEFFPEVSINEGTYIRQFLPNDDLLPVVDLNARFLNTFRPFNSSDSDAWYSGVSLRTRIDITENSTTEDVGDVYFLKLGSFQNDSTTLFGRIRWEQEMDLLGEVDAADVSVGYSSSESLNRRSREALKTEIKTQYLNSNINIGSRTQARFDLIKGQNTTASNTITNRNYDIRSYTLTPGLNTTINRNWNVDLSLSYIHKKDLSPSEITQADLFKIKTVHRTYIWRKLQANISLEYRNTKLDGKSTTYGMYELTEGTGEGSNLIWSFTGSLRTSDLLRLTFNYDGRTVRGNPAIHVAKLVLSASF